MTGMVDGLNRSPGRVALVRGQLMDERVSFDPACVQHHRGERPIRYNQGVSVEKGRHIGQRVSSAERINNCEV